MGPAQRCGRGRLVKPCRCRAMGRRSWPGPFPAGVVHPVADRMARGGRGRGGGERLQPCAGSGFAGESVAIGPAQVQQALAALASAVSSLLLVLMACASLVTAAICANGLVMPRVLVCSGLFGAMDCAFAESPARGSHPGCSASVGKATHLAELVGDQAEIWAVDRSAGRLKRCGQCRSAGPRLHQCPATDAATLLDDRPQWRESSSGSSSMHPVRGLAPWLVIPMPDGG